ncbi:MAG: hypothetical protein WC254_07700 [Candidatus Woesearchaeota archaeon]
MSLEVNIFGFNDSRKNTYGWIPCWSEKRYNKAKHEFQDTVEFELNGRNDWYFIEGLLHGNIGKVRGFNEPIIERQTIVFFPVYPKEEVRDYDTDMSIKADEKVEKKESKYYVEYKEQDGEIKFLETNLLTSEEIEKKYGKELLKKYAFEEFFAAQQSDGEILLSSYGKDCKFIYKDKTYSKKDWDKYLNHIDKAKENFKLLISKNSKTKHYL